MKITADFSRVTGKVKPMHGIGQPPFNFSDFSMFRYLKQAGIPYSRLHDVGGWLGGGLYVDIPNLFRDFSADENDPASYDFAFTDRLLVKLTEVGTEPFFRLGVTIENDAALHTYRVTPPTDPAKWARICEHIVRHYNEGWANGYHLHITHWEIWNEPDDCMDPKASVMWQGTPEQYYELYAVTARHLKECFGDTIKVGGYAACGFTGQYIDPNADGKLLPLTETDDYKVRLREWFIVYIHNFFRYITAKETKAPLDFFSWHCYRDPNSALKEAEYVRRVLNFYGFADVPDMITEWNTCAELDGRDTPRAAALAMAYMLGMQKQTVAEMNFYDAQLGATKYGGMFDPSLWRPYYTYYSFLCFNDAYKCENEVYTESEDERVFVLGAVSKSGKKRVLLIANPGDKKRVELDIPGADLSDAEVVRIDGEHKYALTGESVADGGIDMPAGSVAEIRFFL